MAILKGHVRRWSPISKEHCWELDFCHFSEENHFSFKNLTSSGEDVLNNP